MSLPDPPPARKGSDAVTLDDVLYAMEMRPEQTTGESGVFSGASDTHPGGYHSSPGDVSLHAQLELKERDLVLEAELGKALLDKNEELSRANERIAEEFSFKLEVRQLLDHFQMTFVVHMSARYKVCFKGSNCNNQY